MDRKPTCLVLQTRDRSVTHRVIDLAKECGYNATTLEHYFIPGAFLFQAIGDAIKDSDLVIAIVDEESTSNVFFELGMAKGLGKQTLICLTNSQAKIPSDLHGILTLNLEKDASQSLRFAFQKILEVLPTSRKRVWRQNYPCTEPLPLGEKAREYLDDLASLEGKSNEARILSLLGRVFSELGLVTSSEHKVSDRFVDMAVWSDEISTLMLNPLLIEIKYRIKGEKAARSVLMQVEQYLDKLPRGTTLLLLYNWADSEATNVIDKSNSTVLSSNLQHFLEEFERKTFGQVIRELRNRKAHSREGQ